MDVGIEKAWQIVLAVNRGEGTTAAKAEAAYECQVPLGLVRYCMNPASWLARLSLEERQNILLRLEAEARPDVLAAEYRIPVFVFEYLVKRAAMRARKMANTKVRRALAQSMGQQ